MIALLINILILAVVFGILYWIITLIPLAAPFKTVAMVALALIMLVILLGFVGWVPGYQIRGYRY